MEATSHEATEHCKCGSSQLKCAVSIKWTPDSKDLVQKKCKISHYTNIYIEYTLEKYFGYTGLNILKLTSPVFYF